MEFINQPLNNDNLYFLDTILSELDSLNKANSKKPKSNRKKKSKDPSYKSRIIKFNSNIRKSNPTRKKRQANPANPKPFGLFSQNYVSTDDVNMTSEFDHSAVQYELPSIDDLMPTSPKINSITNNYEYFNVFSPQYSGVLFDFECEYTNPPLPDL